MHCPHSRQSFFFGVCVAEAQDLHAAVPFPLFLSTAVLLQRYTPGVLRRLPHGPGDNCSHNNSFCQPIQKLG